MRFKSLKWDFTLKVVNWVSELKMTSLNGTDPSPLSPHPPKRWYLNGWNSGRRISLFHIGESSWAVKFRIVFNKIYFNKIRSLEISHSRNIVCKIAAN